MNSRSYFSKLFKKKYGITPKQYYSKDGKRRY
nr:helix-turn-helix transcriptional regulator [Aquimarina agarivorans]